MSYERDAPPQNKADCSFIYFQETDGWDFAAMRSRCDTGARSASCARSQLQKACFSPFSRVFPPNAVSYVEMLIQVSAAREVPKKSHGVSHNPTPERLTVGILTPRRIDATPLFDLRADGRRMANKPNLFRFARFTPGSANQSTGNRKDGGSKRAKLMVFWVFFWGNPTLIFRDFSARRGGREWSVCQICFCHLRPRPEPRGISSEFTD